MNYYKDNGNLVRYSDYSLDEINKMIPYEKDIYTMILIAQQKEEKEKRKK